MQIDEARSRIDRIDRQIVDLLNERAVCAQAIGRVKEQTERAAYVPDRERQVLERIAGHSEGPLGKDALQSIYREVISACRALERSLTVAFWGPPASNTHVAARKRFGSSTDFLETGSVAEVFKMVETDRADYGVIPVENSTEGVVAHSLDLLFQSELKICSEIYVPIQHNLLSRETRLDQLKKVYTMFQATGQCREWISKNLGHVQLVETTTTARGAALAAEEPGSGAIANLAAAEFYNLNVLAEHIEDNSRNRTRFWVIGRLQPTPSGRDKTSVLFSVPHEPGALVRALGVFGAHDVSLTFIESRPTKQTPWEYVFFIDVYGHVAEGEETSLGQALRDFARHCTFIKVLGSYPEAENHQRQGESAGD